MVPLESIKQGEPCLVPKNWQDQVNLRHPGYDQWAKRHRTLITSSTQKLLQQKKYAPERLPLSLVGMLWDNIGTGITLEIQAAQALSKQM